METGVVDIKNKMICVGDTVRTTHLGGESWRGVQEFVIEPRNLNGEDLRALEIRSGQTIETLVDSTYPVRMSFGVWSSKPNLEIT